jgi:hypothetical protein
MSDHSFATSFSVDRTPQEAFGDGSLRNLIATGEGQPNGRGRPRVPAENLATVQGGGTSR